MFECVCVFRENGSSLLPVLQNFHFNDIYRSIMQTYHTHIYVYYILQNFTALEFLGKRQISLNRVFILRVREREKEMQNYIRLRFINFSNRQERLLDQQHTRCR